MNSCNLKICDMSRLCVDEYVLLHLSNNTFTYGYINYICKDKMYLVNGPFERCVYFSKIQNIYFTQ